MNLRTLSGGLRKPLTGPRAVRLIMGVTLLVTVAAGVLIWLVDHREFPNLGTSLWWSMQTVTTVGYGDVVPKQTGGRFIGAVTMLQGIAFISVVTAAVTATLIEQARRRRGHDGRCRPRVAARADRQTAGAIERALTERRDTRQD